MVILTSLLILATFIIYFSFKKFIRSKNTDKWLDATLANQTKSLKTNPSYAEKVELKAPIKHAVKTTTPQTTKPYLPEDSVLKRHYLTDIASKNLQISHPYPTDSTLKRHYDHMQIALGNSLVQPTEIKTSASSSTSSKSKEQLVAELTKNLELQYTPIPTDSALLRHYRSMIDAKLLDALALIKTQ